MFLSYDTVEAFAVKRNPVLSFPFLKENGELLSICIDSGFLIEPRALTLYNDFYENAFKLTQLYPQYYRFTLAMTIDIEKAGMTGTESGKIAKYVKDEQLWLYDTSDTRRLETLTLLKGQGSLDGSSLEVYKSTIEKLDQFISNPDWYKKFNKPLFYDLTHIIFFLTDNGKQPFSLKNDPQTCLIYMGLLSLLDNDADLLAEVCICLRYLGKEVPKYWDEFLQKSFKGIDVTYDGTVASALNPTVDEYHIYFVLNWYQALNGKPAFDTRFKGRIPSFSIPNMQPSLLSKLSDQAHQNHLGREADKTSLAIFLAGLEAHEAAHWRACFKSTSLSEELVKSFLID